MLVSGHTLNNKKNIIIIYSIHTMILFVFLFLLILFSVENRTCRIFFSLSLSEYHRIILFMKMCENGVKKLIAIMKQYMSCVSYACHLL